MLSIFNLGVLIFITTILGLYMSFYSNNKNSEVLPDSRKQTKNMNYSGNVNKLYEYQTVSKISYLNNQYTLDNFFGFNLLFNKDNQKVDIIFKDLQLYTNPVIYLYVYDNNYISQTDAKFDINTLFNDYKRIKRNTNQLGNNINLSNIENGVYTITPIIDGDGNGIITLIGNQGDNKTVQFVFMSDTINDDNTIKGIGWELKTKTGEIKISNIKRNIVKIKRGVELENYYQTDGINGINIYNHN